MIRANLAQSIAHDLAELEAAADRIATLRARLAAQATALVTECEATLDPTDGVQLAVLVEVRDRVGAARLAGRVDDAEPVPAAKRNGKASNGRARA